MHLKDLLKLHFLVLIFGFTAILGKLISVDAVETVIYRTSIAIVGMGAYMFFFKKNIIASKFTLFKLFSIGFIVAAHWILFFGAAKVSNVSICLVGLSTTSVWTSFIEPIFTDKKFSPTDLLFGLVVIGGLYIIFPINELLNTNAKEVASGISMIDFLMGFSMAILSAGLASLFSVLNFNLVNKHEVHQHTITLFEMIGALVGCFFFLPIYKHFIPSDFNFTIVPNDVLWLLILGLVCTVYAYSASVEIMKRISAFTVNLVINLEPVYGIILALIIFPESEKMELNFYLGAGIILIAVLVYPNLNRFKKLLRL